jgi:deazaflavin-dependent oxidoreductase (nitroreductase family)
VGRNTTDAGSLPVARPGRLPAVARHLSRLTVRGLSGLHISLYRATRGLVGRRLARHDMMLLTTTGRVSGRHHTVPLLYLRVKDDLAVIASYGGHPTHPDWYRNLLAEPRAEVQVDGKRFGVIARTADPAERRRLWALAVAEYPGYAGYQEKTDRIIPVVLLRRA